MKIKYLVVLGFITTTCGAYTCNYQELNKPNTKKSTAGVDTWEACIASGKKNGPQSNLVIWLEDDSANFIRGQFVNGPITGEWHEINKGEEQKFLETASAAGKAAPSKKESTTAETKPAPTKAAAEEPKAKATAGAAPEKEAGEAPQAAKKKSKKEKADQSEAEESKQKKEHAHKGERDRKHKKAEDEDLQS